MDKLIKVVVHKFNIAYNEDPYLMAGFPLADWKNTEHGQWCLDNGRELTYFCNPNRDTLGYDVTITSMMTQSKIVEMYLKWGALTV